MALVLPFAVWADGVNGTNIVIGGTAIRLLADDPGFVQILRQRFGNFMTAAAPAPIEFTVELIEPVEVSEDVELEVRRDNGQWILDRGDFRAVYDPAARTGTIRQSANPFSIDSVIRIVHSLVLAEESGFLLHSASALHNGRAFIFAGPSGAGKTTISRLAPADVSLLTDEVSYIRKSDEGRFMAWGTPFAGELGIPGKNERAPVESLFFLEHAAHNRIEKLPPQEALRCLMRDILFFALDPVLVARVFDTASEFLASVDVFRLQFLPDQRVWEMIA